MPEESSTLGCQCDTCASSPSPDLAGFLISGSTWSALSPSERSVLLTGCTDSPTPSSPKATTSTSKLSKPARDEAAPTAPGIAEAGDQLRRRAAAATRLTP